MRSTVVLLVAAAGLLIVALGTDHTSVAWGSVVLSVVAAAPILRRWRRSWLHRHDAEADEEELTPASATADPDVAGQVEPADPRLGGALNDPVVGDDPAEDSADGPPGEEDTDAADLLVVYELTDEVLVVDEQPRYHLARCRWPDQQRAERMPVQEARQLGFTPCAQCRPDKTLARQHRAAGATAAGS